MTIQSCITRGLLVAGILGFPWAAQAQDGAPQPMLRIAAHVLTAEGTRGRDAGIDRIMKPGEVTNNYIHAGRIDDPDGSLCGVRAADTTTRGLTELDKRGLQEAMHVWKIAAKLSKYDGGRQTFDLDWQRFDGGSAIPALSRKQQLTLDDGQTYTIDLVHGNVAARCSTAAVAIEVTAGVKEDPAFADTVLRYDLWLVRQDRAGRKVTKHLVLSALHGATTDFLFTPLTARIPKLEPDQYDFTVATRISGSVRGRMMRDGRVSIELETRRTDRVERGSAAPSSLPPRSAGGRKVLSGVLGDAIEVQLPPASGYSSTPASEKDARQIRERAGSGRAGQGEPRIETEPVQVRDGRLTVNYGPFFDGERVSVIVRVRKAEGAQAAEKAEGADR